MVLSDENTRPSLVKPTDMQGEMGSRKFGGEIRPNRRALGAINQNFIGGHPYPRAVNKGNQVCEKKPLIPAHRPITRKFAAQIASKKQHNKGESKRPNPTAVDEGFIIWEDIEIADVEEEQKPAASDQPVPMALESEPEEKDQMEVEMEDIFDDEPVMDIDGRDSGDALAVVEYVDDLYAYYRKMENCSCVSPNYMSQQADINEKMRAILIDWLVEVHHKFDLRDETLFLTVNIIDRFLAQEGVVRKKLQLVGLVAMLLACKYEEVSVPVVDDLVFISDKAYSRKEILEMERLMLNKLQFNMSVPTPYVFIKRFLKAAQSDKKLELLSFFLMELCLVEYEMLKYTPSFLAAAAIYTAQCTLYGFKQWNKTCEWHSSYSETQLQECSKMIVSYHQKAETGRLTGVHRKYSTSKFGFAAKCEPARFVMEESQQ